MARTGFSHLPQLDGLRAIAILLVFVAHCGLENVVPGGLGVTIFFFLSGYLITSLLRSEAAQTGRIDLPGFFARRALRIWPPLYLTLGLALALSLFVGVPKAVDPWGVLAQVIFLSNYADWWGHGTGVPAMPLWSLAVEEHFYLLFPLLFAGLLISRSPRIAATWCALGCVLVLGIRFWEVAHVPDPGAIYYWSHTRIDSILFGCCLALWQNPALDDGPWQPRPVHVVAALGVLLLCLVIRDEAFRQTVRYSLQGLALFVLFSATLQSQGVVRRMLASRPMRLMATLSYSFYLAHMFILDRIVGDLSIPLRALIGGAITLGYAAAMHHLIERPLVRWRRSLHRVDASATAA